MYDHHQAYLMTILFEVHVKVKFNLFVARAAERSFSEYYQEVGDYKQKDFTVS